MQREKPTKLGEAAFLVMTFPVPFYSDTKKIFLTSWS